jgi:ribose transport system permease protein
MWGSATRIYCRRSRRWCSAEPSILGGQGSYLGTIAGAVLLVPMTALITVVNASEGWRSVILGCLILAMLPLSGRDQSR